MWKMCRCGHSWVIWRGLLAASAMALCNAEPSSCGYDTFTGKSPGDRQLGRKLIGGRGGAGGGGGIYGPCKAQHLAKLALQYFLSLVGCS